MSDELKKHMEAIEVIKNEGDIAKVDSNLTMTDDVRKLIEEMENAKLDDPLASLNVSNLLPRISDAIAASVKRAQEEIDADAEKEKAGGRR